MAIFVDITNFPLMKQILPFIILASIAYSSCQSPKKEEAAIETVSTEVNPPAEGFNTQNSDAKAIEIADKVMEAMGGRKAWDDTRYVCWKFFNSRKHIWDKHTGLARIESLNSDLKIIVDINSEPLTGKVFKDGAELTQPDSLAKYLGYGKSAWINDAYWIAMPFKLKDSGVTLKYSGQDTTQTGTASDVLQLTFEEVGNTPENAYKVWVDQDSNLIKQWAYYRSNDQEKEDFITPWDDYKKYGGILLASNRGRGSMSEIEVLETVPENTFTSFE